MQLLGVRVVLLGDAAALHQACIAFLVACGALVRGLGLQHTGFGCRQGGFRLLHGGLVDVRLDLEEDVPFLHERAVAVHALDELADDLRADVGLLHPTQVTEPGGGDVDIALLHLHDPDGHGLHAGSLPRGVLFLAAGRQGCENPGDHDEQWLMCHMVELQLNLRIVVDSVQKAAQLLALGLA